MFKKINLSKFQFANTMNNFPKKDENKDKRLRKRENMTEKKNPPRGRGYINTSNNYDYNVTEERNYSHEVKNRNEKEKDIRKKMIAKLNIGNKLKK